jgi:SWIM zinc finger
MSPGAATVTDVATRWSPEAVLALAPDEASRQSAAGLSRPSAWASAGTAGELVWGQCAGSGRRPYQVITDLSGPAYTCSCPSRKFPCKHALALLLAWSAGRVPDEPEPAGHAAEWKASRDGRAAATAARSRGQGLKDEAAAARRAGQRAQRVSGGLAELETWLHDQIRAGLSAAQASGGRPAQQLAARMVDAQAPGVASALRRLSVIPVSGDGWPGRLLAAYAQLHLLARAHAQLDTLPPALAAVVRSRVGYTTAREDVLATPAVTDVWQVVAVRELPDEPIPARRTWLRGRTCGRFALLLAFAPDGNFGAHPDATLVPGAQITAGLHFYPGQPPLRALVGTRQAGPVPAGQTPGGAAPGGALLGGEASGGSAAGLLDAWAAALEQDPWLTEWPALVTGTPAVSGEEWQLADAAGVALPLRGRERLWPLLAVSGGEPVTVAGEWGPSGLLPLTVWHGDQAVRL